MLGFLADVVVFVHVAYVGFVVVGLFLIFLGRLLRWNWVRNFWFRAIHVTMIGIVVVEALFGITCPLTTWENRLREMNGETAYQGSFIETEFSALDKENEVLLLASLALGLLSALPHPPRSNRLLSHCG